MTKRYNSPVLKAGARKYLKEQGPFFWLNFILLWIFIYLSWIQISAALLAHLPFSQYLILLINFIFAFCVLAAFLIVMQGRERNRRVFLWTAGIFSVLEFCLQWAPSQPFSEDVYRTPMPYVEYSGRSYGEFTITPTQRGEPENDRPTLYKLNHLGLRFEDGLTQDKPKEEFRVFVLGGSTVFNGYPISHSIPGLLEQYFKEHGRAQAKVYNCGVVGYIAGQELVLLLHYLVDYHPDMVIIYDGGNDIYQPLQYDPRPGYPMNFISYEAGLNRLTSNMPMRQLLNSFLFKSQVVRLIFSRGLTNDMLSMEMIRKQCGYATPLWEERVARSYANNLSKMTGLASAFHFKLFLFLQPMIYLNDAYMRQPVKKNSPGARYVVRQYERVRPLLRELEKSNEGPHQQSYFFDLSTIMKDQPATVFYDIIHVTYEANQRIAQAIFREVNRVAGRPSE